MANEQFKRLGAISSTSSERSTIRPHQAIYATERANLLLGSYRRGDANDPDTYVAAIAAVLSSFEPDIIREATDPRTGIQTHEKFRAFMPNAGELKAFCDDLAARKLRTAKYQSLPPPISRVRREVPADPTPINDPASPFHGKHHPGTILSNFDEATRLYGRPVGAFEADRWHAYGSPDKPARPIDYEF